MSKPPVWSFSSIKLFEQCPKKYYHLRVVKDVKEPMSEAMLYGNRMHKAAEDNLKSKIPVPPAFQYIEPLLKTLEGFPGTRLCEYKMGLKRDLSPCGFTDPDVWWRGIADLIILDDETGSARVVDYKTGKSARYADKSQLELMALGVFAHFPQITYVRAALLFVVCNAFVKASYTVEQSKELWEKWIAGYDRLLTAYDTDVWNPIPSGLCRKHCPVHECVHNGMNR